MEPTLATLPTHTLRLADLATRRPTQFSLTPTDKERQAIAQTLDIIAVKKLTFTGEIAPKGKADWTLHANLGASVTQACVVSLDPVNARIDEPVQRQFIADLPEVDAAEAEMPEDDTIERTPEMLDVAAVMIEALSLALPAFPRAADAELGEMVYTEPGKDAMRDDDAKPFAGLGALRDALEKKGESDS